MNGRRQPGADRQDAGAHVGPARLRAGPTGAVRRARYEMGAHYLLSGNSVTALVCVFNDFKRHTGKRRTSGAAPLRQGVWGSLTGMVP